MTPTLAQIYAAVARVEGEMKGINERLERRDRERDADEKRIRALELANAHAAGRTSVFAAIGGAIAGFCAAWLKSHGFST